MNIVFLKMQQNCLANFKGRPIRSIDLIFENFALILTNKEVLILTSDFTPYQKIPLLKKDSKFIKLLTISPIKTLLVFDTFILSLELQEGEFSCEISEMSFKVINAGLEQDLLILMMSKNDSNYVLSHYSLTSKVYQYTAEICLENSIYSARIYLVYYYTVDVESIKVSFVILGKRVMVITHNKSAGEDKISQIATLKSHSLGLRERKPNTKSVGKKALALKQVRKC